MGQLFDASDIAELNSVEENDDDDEEEEDEIVAEVKVDSSNKSCKSFLKSDLYRELSSGHGYDTQEDDDWQCSVMDPETYSFVFSR